MNHKSHNAFTRSTMDRNSLSKKELAAKYGISTDTLARWLKRANVFSGHRNILSPKELDQVYQVFGKPH